MKKYLALALALSMALTLGACAKPAAPAPAPTPTPAPGVTTPAPKPADKTVYTLKLANNLPTTHPFNVGFEKLIKDMATATDGQVDLKVYPAEQLGKEKDYIDAVFNHDLDLGTTGPSEIARRYKPMMVFDAPYLFDGMADMLKFTNGPDSSIIFAGLEEKFKITPVAHYYYGTREITLNKEVKTPADMKGLKLRVPDAPMQLAYGKAFGANPTPMALGEVYLALQQGVVDGQENPPPTIDTFKFSEVCKYLIKSDHIVALVTMYASMDRLAKLPEDIQKTVKETIAATAEPISQSLADQENALLKKFEEKGMKIIEPDKDAFKAACEPLYKEFEKEWGVGLVEKIKASK